MNWSDLRENVPTLGARLKHKAKHGKKALGAKGQVEHRMRQTFERIYAGRRAVTKLHSTMGWWRLLNDVVYTAWGY